MTIKNSMDKTILVPMKCVYFFKFNMIKLTTLKSSLNVLYFLFCRQLHLRFCWCAWHASLIPNPIQWCSLVAECSKEKSHRYHELLNCYTRIPGKCCLVYLIIQTDRAKIFRKKLPKLFWSHEQDQKIETRSNSAITRSARTSSIF